MISFLHPERLVPQLVDAMNAFQAHLLKRWATAIVVVHEDFAGTGHVENSQHYLGRAVDFHVANVSLTDVWLELERFPALTGIGFYPDWSKPGFHADVREEPIRARWMRRGSDAYLEFNRQAMALMLAIEKRA